MRIRTRFSAGLIAIAITGACASGPSVSSGVDPAQSASAVSLLPPNIGPSDCHPISPNRRVGSNTEVSGQNGRDAQFWALFPDHAPFPSGQDLRVRLAVNGEHGVRIVLGGPSGQQIRLDRVYPDFGASWGRPGSIWAAIVNFPSPGCWRVSVDRQDKHADFWVQVK